MIDTNTVILLALGAFLLGFIIRVMIPKRKKQAKATLSTNTNTKSLNEQNKNISENGGSAL
ncbi:MAG: hypothetical protein FWD49_00355 [Firmicutes bacterium]|nr:hypothetical protein [Bacillota bacterium]